MSKHSMNSVKTKIGKGWMRIYAKPEKRIGFASDGPAVPAPSRDEALAILDRRIKKLDRRKK